MRDKIRELEELVLVYKNTGAEWASPPLILPKPVPDQYRMTVDLRVPNALTKPTAWPMPNLQNELHDLHGSEVFALKLHASKCVLFASTVRYCGRLITKDGVSFDPKNMEALQTMQEPQNGADLVQYVAAVN
jgi:hypothetical protein